MLEVTCVRDTEDLGKREVSCHGIETSLPSLCIRHARKFSHGCRNDSSKNESDYAEPPADIEGRSGPSEKVVHASSLALASQAAGIENCERRNAWKRK